MSTLRLTIVVDNKAAEGLVVEHGYALWIETPHQNILFDTGQQQALLPNCATLGVDLASATALVLSHGHYDHVGGVHDVLRLNKNLHLYLHSGVFQPRYSLDGEEPRSVRMPLPAMAAVMKHPDNRIHWLTKPAYITKDIGIVGPVPRVTDFEDAGGPFYLDPDGREADVIKDDTAMWFKTGNGLVVAVGCCHAGLVNTLRHILSVTGETMIHTVIGGLHLLHADTRRLETTVAGLREFNIRQIIPCHCTGDSAVSFLAEHLEAEVRLGFAGLSIEF